MNGNMMSGPPPVRWIQYTRDNQTWFSRPPIGEKEFPSVWDPPRNAWIVRVDTYDNDTSEWKQKLITKDTISSKWIRYSDNENTWFLPENHTEEQVGVWELPLGALIVGVNGTSGTSGASQQTATVNPTKRLGASREADVGNQGGEAGTSDGQSSEWLKGLAAPLRALQAAQRRSNTKGQNTKPSNLTKCDPLPIGGSRRNRNKKRRWAKTMKRKNDRKP